MTTCLKCGTPIPEPWPEEYVCPCGSGATIRPWNGVSNDTIRAAALEEVASMAEEYFSDNTISGVSPQWVADEIAAMIRALKEQP